MTQPSQLISTADGSGLLSQAQVLSGRYDRPYRSHKGKLKGLMLQAGPQEYCIKLPKYLRPMLVREVEVGDFLQVWAAAEDDIWRAINVLPLPENQAEALQQAWQDRPPSSLPAELVTPTEPSAKAVAPTKQCIQVCRKGKCYKQGSQHIWSALQAEIEANPELQHISIEATGCMKACKKGPNLKVLPQGKMMHRVTPEQALTVLSDCQ